MGKFRVLLLGAGGKTGSEIRKLFVEDSQIILTSVARRTLTEYPGERVELGDLTNVQFLKKVMKDQDIIIASLSGDLLAEAQAIHEAAVKTGSTRVVWLTGIGVHREATGSYGAMLNTLTTVDPDFVQAAETIAQSDLKYTLLRLPQLKIEHTKREYHIKGQNEAPVLTSISKENVAKFLLFLTKHSDQYIKESISISDH